MSIRISQPPEIAPGLFEITGIGDNFLETLKQAGKSVVGTGVDRVVFELKGVNTSLGQAKALLVTATAASLIAAALAWARR